MSRRINRAKVAHEIAAACAERDETPRDAAMRMARELQPPELDGFATLQMLLWDYSVAAIATAVETHGIQGLDRFGRLRPFTARSAEAGEVLQALAALYRSQADWLRNVDTTDEARQPLAFLANFGWPEREVPELGPASPQPMPRASAETKRQDTLLRLVVVLAAEHGIDVTRANAAPELARFFEDRGTKPPAPNTLNGIVARARDVADRFEIVTTATLPR